MSAEKAEVVSQHVAIKFFAKLSAKDTATDSTSETAEERTRNCAEGDTERTGNGAHQCRASTARGTANSADGGSDFHCVTE